MNRKFNEYAFVLLCGLVQSTFIVNLSLYLHDGLSLAPELLTAVLSGYFAISMAFSIAVGAVSDHFGRHITLIRIIASLISIGCVAAALSGYRSLAIAALLLGITPAGSLGSLGFAHFSAMGKPGSRIVFLRSIVSASWVIGPMLGTWIVARGGFRWLFITIGLFCLLLALLSVPMPQYVRLRNRNEVKPVGAATTIVHLAVPLAAVTFLQGAMSVSTTILPIVVTRDMSAPQIVAAYAFSLCALLEVLCMVQASRWMNRRSNRDLMLFGCLVGGLYYLGIFFVTDPWLLLPLQAFNATYIAVVIGVGLAWFQAVAPERPGLATSLFVNAYNAGAIVATVLLGYVVTVCGTYQCGAIIALFFIGSGAGLVAVLSKRETPPCAGIARNRV